MWLRLVVVYARAASSEAATVFARVNLAMDFLSAGIQAVITLRTLGIALANQWKRSYVEVERSRASGALILNLFFCAVIWRRHWGSYFPLCCSDP